MICCHVHQVNFSISRLVREAEAKLAEEAAAQKEKEDLLLEIKLKVIYIIFKTIKMVIIMLNLLGLQWVSQQMESLSLLHPLLQ